MSFAIDTKTIYISIGNSDDKLSQNEWTHFQAATHEAVSEWAIAVHGRWASLPDQPWQNACWCVEIQDGSPEGLLKRALADLARTYRQDSIAWAEATTEFIGPQT